MLKAVGCSRAHSVVSWELEVDEAAKEVRPGFPISNILLSLTALVLVLYMRSGSFSTTCLIEVLDYQLLKAGCLCLYKNRTVLEDWTNECACATQKAECRFFLQQVVSPKQWIGGRKMLPRV